VASVVSISGPPPEPTIWCRQYQRRVVHTMSAVIVSPVTEPTQTTSWGASEQLVVTVKWIVSPSSQAS
jgi:hypothetical protein